MKNVAKMTGAAALLGGVLVLTGCQSSKVMDNRPYIPAASSDEVPAALPPMQEPAEAEVKDLPIAPPPAAPAAPAVHNYPRLDEVEYTPVAKKAAPAAGGVYVVKKGDTVSGIAYRHGVRTADMLALNGLDNNSARRLKVGQKLTLPEGAKARNVPARKSSKAVKKAVKPVAGAAVAAGGTYTVRRGDNIPKIARKLGVKARDLMAANNLDEAATRRLQIGQKLIVPGRGGASASPAAPVTPVTPVTAEEQAPAVTPVTDTAAPTEAGAAAAPAAEAGAAAAPAGEAGTAVDKVEETQFTSTTVEHIQTEITVREYLKSKNVTLDVFKTLNGASLVHLRRNGEDMLDAVITPGMTIFLPSAPAAAAEAPAAATEAPAAATEAPAIQ